MANIANRIRLAELRMVLTKRNAPQSVIDSYYPHKQYRRERTLIEADIDNTVAAAKVANRKAPGYRQHTTKPKRIRRLFNDAHKLLDKLTKSVGGQLTAENVEQAKVELLADIRRPGATRRVTEAGRMLFSAVAGQQLQPTH